MLPRLRRAVRRLLKGADPAAGAWLFYANSSQSNGFSFLDALILGMVIFVAIRLFSGGSRRRPPRRDHDGASPPPPIRTRPTDRYEAAQAAWEALASRKPDQPAAPQGQAQGFDAEEFLSGAKAAMMRVHQALRDNDFDDLAHFATPRLLDELKAQARAAALEKDSEILLMDAELLDSRQEGSRTLAQVSFSTLEGAHGRQDSSRRLVRVVDFVRDLEADDPHWKLDQIRMQSDEAQGLPS